MPICIGKIDWSMNFEGDGRGIARDIKKKIIVIFKTRQKMVT